MCQMDASAWQWTRGVCQRANLQRSTAPTQHLHCAAAISPPQNPVSSGMSHADSAWYPCPQAEPAACCMPCCQRRRHDMLCQPSSSYRLQGVDGEAGPLHCAADLWHARAAQGAPQHRGASQMIHVNGRRFPAALCVGVKVCLLPHPRARHLTATCTTTPALQTHALLKESRYIHTHAPPCTYLLQAAKVPQDGEDGLASLVVLEGGARPQVAVGEPKVAAHALLRLRATAGARGCPVQEAGTCWAAWQGMATEPRRCNQTSTRYVAATRHPATPSQAK